MKPNHWKITKKRVKKSVQLHKSTRQFYSKINTKLLVLELFIEISFIDVWYLLKSPDIQIEYNRSSHDEFIALFFQTFVNVLLIVNYSLLNSSTSI